MIKERQRVTERDTYLTTGLLLFLPRILIGRKTERETERQDSHWWKDRERQKERVLPDVRQQLDDGAALVVLDSLQPIE